MIPFDVVILAGGSSTLHPLTDGGLPSCLVSLCNTPLLALTARLLEHNAVKHAHVVCEGSIVAAHVSDWVTANQQELGKLTLQVVEVAQGTHSADVLRQLLPQLHAEAMVVLPVDLVTHLSLQEVVLGHWVARAVATVVLSARRTLASTETKIGRPPKGVDYVGLSADNKQLLFLQSSPDAQRDVKLPFTTLMAASHMHLTTRLQDTNLYVLQRHMLTGLLTDHPQWTCITTHLLPHLLAHQVRLPDGDSFTTVKSTSASLTQLDAPSCTADQFQALNHAPPTGLGSQLGIPGINGWFVGAHVVPATTYCRRVRTLGVYAETSREVTVPRWAEAVLGVVPSMHASVTVGNKSSVAPGCVVGRGTVLGDKCSVKRTVVGSHCSIGNNVKLINSVVMDNVSIGDGCHIQNSILCNRVVMQPHVSLKDCTLGPGYVVTEGQDLKDEVLSAKANEVAGSL